MLDKVRDYVEDVRVKGGSYPYIKPSDVAETLNVKESVINQAMSILQKEGVLLTRRGTFGSYSLKTPTPFVDPLWPPFPQRAKSKRRVSWGSKKKVLALVRKTKPWVIEKWWEEDKRWYMYMSRTCAVHLSSEVAPENQPDLTRTEIAKWHFDMEGAIQACAHLRRKFPKDTFRTRDTSAGEYIMGAIL